MNKIIKILVFLVCGIGVTSVSADPRDELHARAEDCKKISYEIWDLRKRLSRLESEGREFYKKDSKQQHRLGKAAYDVKVKEVLKVVDGVLKAIEAIIRRAEAVGFNGSSFAEMSD